MSTCKDCLHFAVCEGVNQPDYMTAHGDECKFFKNKTDYEKVTHCEKCKHYLSREERCTEGQPEGYGYCREQNDYFKPTFYCGYGELKDGKVLARSELKPCPFCGGEAEIKPTSIYSEKGLCVHCKDCNIHTTSTLYECKYNQFEGKTDVYVTKEMAEEHVTKKWNRRVNNA